MSRSAGDLLFGSYIPLLVELLLAMMVVLVTVAIGARRLDDTIVWIAKLLLRILGLVLFLRLLTPLVGYAVDGFLPRLFVGFLAAGLATIAALRLVPSAWRDRCRTRVETFVQRRPAWLRVSAKTLMLLGFWGAMLIGVDLTATAIAGSRLASDCKNHTLLLHHWVGPDNAGTNTLTSVDTGPPPNAVAEPDRTRAISVAADRQADFFARFANGVQTSKSELYARVGIDDLKHEFQLVQRLHQLDLEDKLWLIANNEDLAVLAADPAFKRILENEQLLDRIDRFAAGSLDQIVYIGMDDDINGLLENGEFRQRIAKIDLQDLLRQCEQRPRPPSQPK